MMKTSWTYTVNTHTFRPAVDGNWLRDDERLLSTPTDTLLEMSPPVMYEVRHVPMSI